VIAATNNGDFVVAWESGEQDGDLNGIFARRFSSDGTAFGVEFQVNTYTTHLQDHPVVAMDGDGDFVIAWSSGTQDGSYTSVFAQRFTSSGAATGAEFQVNSYTRGYQDAPSVAMSAIGDFVVVWTTHGYFAQQDGSLESVFGQRFTSYGERNGAEFQLSAYTLGPQLGATVAEDAAGGFVAAWGDFDGSNGGIVVRRFSSAGIAIGRELQVNSYTTGMQTSATITADSDGDFVLVWNSFGQDGSSWGLFAQRFAGPIVLDMDGDGTANPLTDGIVLLRFMFGFSGPSLTGGAVAPSCTRCDAAAIEPYLTSLGSVIDIDGNTMSDALTDGLLAVRYLFGFGGAILTTGAVGGGCTRCDAAAIEPYLAAITN
jgi:hypothetical protein